MRWWLLIGILFIAASASAQAPSVTPANPIIALSGTQQFTCVGTCTGGTGWACSGCTEGGVSAGGLYTANATGTAKQSLAGYQLLPKDHIFNTNISGFSVNSNNAAWIAEAAGVSVNFAPGYSFNYINGSTPTDTMSFYYTAANNGTFKTPVWPAANIEHGWFDAIMDASPDHHLFSIDTTNGNLYEMYQYYGTAAVTSCTVNGSNSATCNITPSNTSDGFIQAAVSGFHVQMGGWTGGDTYLNTSGLLLTSATHTTITFNITHAAASTSTSGHVTLDGNSNACSLAGTCNSASGIKYTYADYPLPANGATNAAGTTYLPVILRSQEIINACNNSVPITHAVGFTLSIGKIALNTFNWPATTGVADGGIIPMGAWVRLKSAFDISSFSACAQVLLTQMKNYGMILTDGGLNWEVETDYDNATPLVYNTMNEISNAAIAESNWEFIDPSGVMESSSSGAVNTGERVCFNSSSGTGCTHANVQNSAINFQTNQWYTMAGTPQLQLPVFSNGAYTCTMSPTVGSLTTSGLYTAPASVTVGTKSQTTVTCASSVTSTVKAEILVTVFPATNFNITMDSADFTDSHSTVWFSGGQIGFGLSFNPQWPPCCQPDSSITGTDHQLFWNRYYGSINAGDVKADFHVPNGTYAITFNNGTSLAAGTTRYFYVQGALTNTVDSTVAAGGQNLKWTYSPNATVSNNTLSIYNAQIGNQSNPSGDISSISILGTSTPGTIPAAPSNLGILLLADKR